MYVVILRNAGRERSAMRTWERRRHGLENVNEQTRCGNTE